MYTYRQRYLDILIIINIELNEKKQQHENGLLLTNYITIENN